MRPWTQDFVGDDVLGLLGRQLGDADVVEVGLGTGNERGAIGFAGLVVGRNFRRTQGTTETDHFVNGTNVILSDLVFRGSSEH